MDGEGLALDGGLGEAALLIGVELKWDLPGGQVDLLTVFGRPELAKHLVIPVEGRRDREAPGDFQQLGLLLWAQAALRLNLPPKCRGFIQEIV